MKPILVLGALGNVGTEVVRALVSRGASVRAADLSIERLRERFGESVEALAFDFAKSSTWPAAFEGVERAFLMRPPQIANIKRDMVPALEAAKSAGLRHFVFLSLIGIESNTVVPHWKVEEWLRSSGLAWTMLRSSFFMQNLNTTHREEIRDRDELFIPVGDARTSFIDVRDLGAVAALALTETGHENKAYNLTGGEAFTYDQVASIFTEILGRKIVYKRPSAGAFFRRMIARRQKLMFALVTTWLYSNTKSGMADIVTSEVERLLGRKPASMRNYIEDYRGNWETNPRQK